VCIIIKGLASLQ